MKKQFQIFATVLISVAIVSCTKQSVDEPIAQQSKSEEISTNIPSAERLVVNPLNVNLAGSYQFNNNLKDQTGKLADAQRWPLSRVAGAIYTYDRKGIAKSALKFDGNYYLTISNVPVQQKMSLSFWIRKFATNIGNAGSIVRHNSTGLEVNQIDNQFWGRVMSYANDLSQTSIFSKDFPDTKWHHIVVTYSDDAMTMYIDNQLQGKTSNIFTVIDNFTKYLLGYAHGYSGQYWKGEIDDLRFYSRTLSATDVQKLYNL